VTRVAQFLPTARESRSGYERQKSLRILLVAEESPGLQLIREIARTKHELVGVVATSDLKGGMSGRVWQLAQTMGLHTWPGESVKDPRFARRLGAENIDVLLNVHSLHLICPEVLEVPRLGAFNLHPGPLPRYAGLNAPSWALYNDESNYAVTVHRIEPGIDTGPVVFEAPFKIGCDDNALALFMQCVKLGVPLLMRLLQSLAMDPKSLPLTPQDVSQRRYFGRKVPDQGRLIWNRPAAHIVNFVRACDYYPFVSPWGYPLARLGDRSIRIVRAQRSGGAVDAPPGTITGCDREMAIVAAADETIGIRLVEWEGKIVPAAKVLEPGVRLGDG